jgi:hypothetical protein
MLITPNVTDAGGVTSSRAVVRPAAAAQYVQRSPSTALVASKPGLAQVESAEMFYTSGTQRQRLLIGLGGHVADAVSR